jgi:hypothetical protein
MPQHMLWFSLSLVCTKCRTIMKAPLLLGNDIRKMDEVALGVVKNKDALNISQDSLGIQAQRVWSARGPSSLTDRLNPDMSAAAVAAPLPNRAVNASLAACQRCACHD